MSALTDRDTNLQSISQPSTAEKQTAAGEENKSQESQQHRQVLEQKIAENNGYVCIYNVPEYEDAWLMQRSKPGQNYISPSDAILSPASLKLADMKQRQMNKQ